MAGFNAASYIHWRSERFDNFKERLNNTPWGNEAFCIYGLNTERDFKWEKYKAQIPYTSYVEVGEQRRMSVEPEKPSTPLYFHFASPFVNPSID